MIKPTHGAHTFSALRVFTDRDGPRAIFREALRADQRADQYRVLVWYGVGGQGKSALLAEFDRILDAERQIAPNLPRKRVIASASIDFGNASMRVVDQALLSLRLQLARAGIRFPTFDTAFAQYIALTNPGASLRERHPELFLTENEVLDDLASVAKDALGFVAETASLALPGINFAYKYGVRLTGYAREWWDRRGIRELNGLGGLTADGLLRALPRCLGADICAAQSERHLRVIVLMDTFEALWRDRGLKDTSASLVDEWVRAVVQEMPGALFVIAARDRLRWGQIDGDWDSFIEQHCLDCLSRQDMESYLVQIPVDEPEVRTRMISGAVGQPFYLELQVDLYEQRRRQQAQPLASDFGGTHRQILTRFLDHLSHEDELLLRLAAYPEYIDEPLLASLSERFLGGRGFVNWDRFTQWSFMQVQPGEKAIMHGLMRAALQGREEEERVRLFRDVHDWLHQHFDSGLAGDATTHSDGAEQLRRATFHADKCDAFKFGKWLWERSLPFFSAGKSALLAPSWNQVFPQIAEELPQERRELLTGYARVLSATNRYAEARSLLNSLLEESPTAMVARELAGTLLKTGDLDRSTEIYHKLAFEAHFENDAIGGREALHRYAWDLLGLSIAIMEAAAAEPERKLLTSVEQYLVWAERASDPRTAVSAQIIEVLAEYHRRAGHHDLAATNAVRAIRRWQELCLEEQDERARYTLALNHRDTRELATAAKQLELVAHLFTQRSGDDHQDTLRCRQVLGTVLLALGERERARAILEPTIQRLTQSLPVDHHWLAEANNTIEALKQ